MNIPYEWDLTSLYQGLDDPDLKRDIQKIIPTYEEIIFDLEKICTEKKEVVLDLKNILTKLYLL